MTYRQKYFICSSKQSCIQQPEFQQATSFGVSLLTPPATTNRGLIQPHLASSLSVEHAESGALWKWSTLKNELVEGLAGWGCSALITEGGARWKTNSLTGSKYDRSSLISPSLTRYSTIRLHNRGKERRSVVDPELRSKWLNLADISYIREETSTILL